MAIDTKATWKARAEKELAGYEDDRHLANVSSILRNLLFSSDIDDQNAIRQAAQEIYTDEVMRLHPEFLYTLLFSLARVLPYNEPQQPSLIKLLVELRNLPPRPLPVEGVRNPFPLYYKVLQHWAIH